MLNVKLPHCSKACFEALHGAHWHSFDICTRTLALVLVCLPANQCGLMPSQNQRMCSMHPNIVQLREVFLTEHHLAVAMEYADGGDLSEYIDQQYQRGVR